MTELLPCPWCGDADGLTLVGLMDIEFIECQSCAVSGPDGGAVAWNRRAGSSQPGDRYPNNSWGGFGPMLPVEPGKP